MEIPIFLFELALVLFFARVFGQLAAYFRVSPVLGELLAGVIIGPSLLGWVAMTPMMEVFAQIAILLLLFEVGIQTDVERLVSSGMKASLVAVGGVVLPLCFGFCTSYFLFSFSFLTSLFVGSTLTATSIGITLRVLQDMKKQHSQESQIVLGAAILDDILGIVLLSILYEFAFSKEVNWMGAAKVVSLIALFCFFAPLLVKAVAHFLEKWEKKNPMAGFIPTSTTILILLFGCLAYLLGAPELLGGFVAGLAFSKRFKVRSFLPKNIEFSEKVEKGMAPIVGLFTPVFFVGIGLSLDLSAINFSSSSIWLLTGALTLGGFLGKILAGFLLNKENFIKKMAVGIAMTPRGEVGFVFASVGLSADVFSVEVYTALVLVIMITTVFSPPLLRFFYNKFDVSNGKKLVDYLMRK